MSDPILQTVSLPATAEALFHMYLDPTEHQAITGSPVTIGPVSGAAFNAFEGSLSGTILAVVEPHLIVQSWRSVDFKPEDPDSTLVLSFIAQADAGRIDLVHVNVPQHDRQAVLEGWENFYWTPWREYLERE